MKNYSILLMFHCGEHTGYAIEKLEQVFFKAALLAGFSEKKIFWLYSNLSNFTEDKIACSYHYPSSDLPAFIRRNNILFALAFDLGYPCRILKILKENGVKRIISYWGASISSINYGLKLAIKKMEYILRANVPDHFIFESECMRLRATHGRGIKFSATSVINLGVDTSKYFPKEKGYHYAHDVFSLPYTEKIVFYSGHMEERKGVRVIINAAKQLIGVNKLENVHFLLCGNKDDEAGPYLDLLAGSSAKNHVTFAGYRNDIPELMRSSHIGVIASTGWDSFTMSSVEMMASGLPLIVSDLEGLAETVIDWKNGFKTIPGDSNGLAKKIELLCLDNELAERFSLESRNRAIENFSIESQIINISQKIASISDTIN